MSFESFAFHPQVHAGIMAAGYIHPTSIQERAIPPILSGRDLLGLAQTGTGKTAAFVLPILQKLRQGPRGKLRALIVAPTRELAEQTHVAIQALGRRTGLRSLTLYGGVGANPQIQRLRQGAEIAVACPGRLLDLMGQRYVDLSSVEVLVLDEADMMFDMGFLPDVRRILAAVPAKRQTLLFSATMPAEIRALAAEILHDPITVEISPSRPVETVAHAVYPVEPTQKTDLLLELIRQAGEGQVLVFTRTKHRARKVAQQLVQAGVRATSLQGNLSQNQRQAAMDAFRSGRAKVMVATDIAARGIDVSQITHVINYDLPDTAETYTHRIGRTGRMERLGTALSLVTVEDVLMLRTIEKLLGKPLERRSLPGFEGVVLAASAPAIPGRSRQQRPAGPSNQYANRRPRRFAPQPAR
ncbi:MAG TPA: DEAD/DEAH box helicase [Anaerolineaceae bacterium]|nr:DEAD/DEAH box helicase [Anaerolineaceae bacterium]HQO97720.1 DEAD/DEAH box helicase [Anaerolineaceae bacterium]